jgi:hypothetical protein
MAVHGLRLAVLGAALLLMAAAPAAGTLDGLRFADAARPRLTLSPAALKGRPHVLLLWRSDCGPCLLELQHLRAFEDAAPPGALVLLALDPPERAQDKLQGMGVRPDRLWYALDDNARVLSALGGPPPRLPLTVAVDAGGRVCARRTGLLGTDIVKQWVAQCRS